MKFKNYPNEEEKNDTISKMTENKKLQKITTKQNYKITTLPKFKYYPNSKITQIKKLPKSKKDQN